MILDFGGNYQFRSRSCWYVGITKWVADEVEQLQSSSDDNTYTNIDLSGVTNTSISYSGGGLSSTEAKVVELLVQNCKFRWKFYLGTTHWDLLFFYEHDG